MCVCVVKPARTTQHRRLFDFRFRWCAYRARIVVNSWYKLQMAARLQTRAGPPARPADFNQSCQGCRSTGGWMQTEADAFVSCSKKERERKSNAEVTNRHTVSSWGCVSFSAGSCVMYLRVREGSSLSHRTKSPKATEWHDAGDWNVRNNTNPLCLCRRSDDYFSPN